MLSLRARLPERGLDLELELPAGESLALVGPNGAGKSSALALIAGLLRPAEGRITLGGRVLTEVVSGRTRTLVPPARRGIALLSQDPLLLPHRTVAGNLHFALRTHGVPPRRARARARELLEQAGLAHLARRRPAQLSGGQAQRVAILRALATEPRLLLLDEPLAALDVEAAPQVRALLTRTLETTPGLVVTHELLDAASLAPRLAVIEHGRVVDHRATSAVLADPRTAFTARLAGLSLLHGLWRDGAVELADGSRLAADTEAALAAGQPVRATVRPSRVGLADEDPPTARATVIERPVESLEPHGDLIRLRTPDLAADLDALVVARAGLAPGARVRLCVPPSAVQVHAAGDD